MSVEISLSALKNVLMDRDDFLTGLLNLVRTTKSTGWLQDVRDSAANFVRQSTLPSTRDEEWRFTDLSGLRQVQFNNVETLYVTSPQPDVLVEAVNSRLVFVNGVYAPELSSVAGLPDGVVVGNLAGLSANSFEFVKNYLAQSEGGYEVFTALNTAGMSDAAVVWVPKNVVVKTPIHLVFIAAGNTATISQPRCLVVAETGSQVTFIEEFTSCRKTDGVYFTNAVTEIWVGENAQVSHTVVDRSGAEAFHVGKTAVSQARSSRYICNAVVFGGKLSRHNLEITQTGEQTETILNGLTMIADKQVADTHSAIALNYPHGVSKQLQKNIVGDRAHAVFNGKVFVPKPAQLTDASQLNRNLLLSAKARVDTKPKLEITADNVKCAHGATVSQLEDDEIFYLQSRGIDQNDARNLLINAFASEIINKIPILSLRETLLQLVERF